MSATDPINPKRIDPRIRKELLITAHRLKENKVYIAGAKRWLVASVLALIVLGIRFTVPAFGGFAFPLICGLVAVTLFLNYIGKLKTPLDYLEAAQAVEQNFPEVEGLLSTALQQTRDGDSYNFLQEKLFRETLHYSNFQYWEDVGKKKSGPSKAAFLGAMSLLLGLAAITYYTKDVIFSINTPSMPVLISSVEVTPGNTAVERGSAIVIAARYKGDVPRSATLIVQQDNGTTQRHSMAQSLSDPVFAYTLQSIEEAAHYLVEYGGKETERYRLEVFNLPALTQANAFLNFPDYTGLKDRLIEDTRRVSAVEGTRLTYEFLVNKPLASAELIDRDGNVLALTPSNPEKTRFSTEMLLTEDLRYDLHLTDDAGRKNTFPPDVRITVRENKKPEIKLNFPRGDQAVSPIEELALEASAQDDFGLVDYGLAITVGADNPNFVSLKSDDPEQLEADFEKLYALEDAAVEVDQLVTWFAWADDMGVEGEVRRSTSDLFYAEVRPLEEIYREGEGGGGEGQGQGGEQEAEALEQQRNISIATFKLKDRGERDSSFLEDTQVLLESQQQVSMQVQEMIMELQEDKKLLAAATDALDFMEKAVDAFGEALDEESDGPIEDAWLATQGAYQSLLRLRPREMNVNQSRQQGGGGGGNNRNQRQLNQLDFGEEENRYETESQAQAMTTPQEREELEVLSKLSELARRQGQMNDRLKELQTALAAAEDEEEREKIQRELKRLEEEQRQMLTQMDEVRQRMDNMPADQEARDAREQLEETREDMRNISEALEDGEVSQALASGSRVQENLEQLKEDFRQSTSSQFSDAMRQVRDAAQELAETQRELSEELDALENEQAPRLDGSGERAEVAERYSEQQENLEQLMNDLRQITEDSESGEPTLHRKLYDLVRRQNQSDAQENLEIAEELVSRGFLEQAQDMQPGLQASLNELERAVTEAAESVMGDETTALRFAQEELSDLLNELEQERPEGSELADAGSQGSGESSQPGQAQGQTGGEPGESQTGSTPGEEQDGQLAQAQSQQPGQSPGQGQEGQQPGQPGGQQPEQSQQPGSGQQPGQGGQQEGTQPGGQLAQGGQQPGQGQSPGQQPGQGGQPGQGQGGQPSGQPGQGQRGGQQTSGGGGGNNQLQDLQDIIRSFADGGNGAWEGPITGDGFVDWNERMRTIEELMELPEAREQMQQAREQAEQMRVEFKRHGTPPQWGDIDTTILQPIREVESWVQQELLRKDNPDTLQPIDRDPVPPKYSNSVKSYYEALGGD